jgi:hypothetical protein
VSPSKWSVTFHRIIVSVYSGSNHELLDLEDEGTTIPQNAVAHLANSVASHPWRLACCVWSPLNCSEWNVEQLAGHFRHLRLKPSKWGLNSFHAAIPDPHVSIRLSSLSCVMENYESPINSYSRACKIWGSHYSVAEDSVWSFGCSRKQLVNFVISLFETYEINFS